MAGLALYMMMSESCDWLVSKVKQLEGGRSHEEPAGVRTKVSISTLAPFLSLANKLLTHEVQGFPSLWVN